MFYHVCSRNGKIARIRFELIPYATYLPDLTPFDFFLFPNLKKWLSRKKFSWNAPVEEASYFNSILF